MNTPSSHSRLREHLPMVPQREQHFTWRGEEVSRVEGFTDAVFAFAVSLLVFSLEVPRTLEGLLDVVRGFPAFIICFTFLMIFWNAHYRYHRRYGLEGAFTRVMTMAILALVLFFVYPLKFLWTAVTVGVFGLDMHDAPRFTEQGQVKQLFVIYGLGYAGVWGLYAALYAHALRLRDRLRLSPIELMMTRASFVENLIYGGVCLLSVLVALFINNDSLPGLIYFLLPVLLTFNGFWFGRQQRALAKQSSQA